MKKLICALLIAALLLPVCALADDVVYVFNWEDYIDESVLDMFKEETGIEVKYSRFTDNEEMIIQVESDPSFFDVVFPSEYMVERMIAKNLLAEINFDNVPNFTHIRDSLKNPSYDPENTYSIPYMWGTLGILYNTKMVDEADMHTWGVLFDDKYAGQILMMDSLRDTMGLALRYLGYSMNSNDFLELDEATNLLIDQKQRGLVKAYGLDEFKDKMVANEAAMAVVYSGDAQYAIELNPDLAYVVPSEGSNIWVDCAVIPALAKHKENAEKFIDFLCRPDIAVLNAEAIGYCTPNAAALELLDEDYLGSDVTNPSEEITARCEVYNDLEKEDLDLWTSYYGDVKGAKVLK